MLRAKRRRRREIVGRELSVKQPDLRRTGLRAFKWRVGSGGGHPGAVSISTLSSSSRLAAVEPAFDQRRRGLAERGAKAAEYP